MAIIHETPGEIDLRAFTTFGVNSKPNSSNPIGYFGTGLKYAVAVLARLNCPMTVWIGEEPHVFYSQKMNFRGKDFLQLRMKRKRGLTSKWMSQELPFTTELGKNWEIWMALRELHSNTLDEQGMSCQLPAGTEGEAGKTRIIVEGQAYAEAFEQLGQIFLPPADGEAKSDGYVERREGESEFAFYRGLRVHKLAKPSLWTWNLLATNELTEDRTLKHGFMLDYYVRQFVKKSKSEDFIKGVLQADEDSFEGSLDFSSQLDDSSEEFKKMARLYGKNTSRSYIIEYDRARVKPAVEADWRSELLAALRDEDELETNRLVQEHRERLIAMLQTNLRLNPTQPMPAKLETDSYIGPESEEELIHNEEEGAEA